MSYWYKFVSPVKKVREMDSSQNSLSSNMHMKTMVTNNALPIFFFIQISTILTDVLSSYNLMNKIILCFV